MEQQSYNNHNNKEKKVFVGGLPHGTTDEEFETYFGQFGAIKDMVIIYDKETSKCRGFGFVTFENDESFNAVVQNRFHKLKDKLVEVKKALPKEAKNNNDINNNIASTNYRTVPPQLANPNTSGLATSTHYPYYNHHVYSQHSQQHNHYGNYALNGHNGPYCDNYPLNGYLTNYNCSDYCNYPLNSGYGPVHAHGYASSSNNNPNPVQSTRPNYGEARININGWTNPARRNSNPVRISRPNGEPIENDHNGRANPAGSDPNPIRVTRTDGDASEGKENDILETK